LKNGALMTEDLVCTVEVMLNGEVHEVLVTGNHSPALGFEAPGSWTGEPALLRLRCEVCNVAAKLSFIPPSVQWRRPFVVSRVTHLSND
jgi:hypothetical protein